MAAILYALSGSWCVLSSPYYLNQGGCTDLNFEVKLNMLLHIDGVGLRDIKPNGEYIIHVLLSTMLHIDMHVQTVCTDWISTEFTINAEMLTVCMQDCCYPIVEF